MKLNCSAAAGSNQAIQSADALSCKLNQRHYMSKAPSSSVSRECDFFIQSFNRENLQYQVEYKTSNQAALDKIVDVIKSKFANKSGIVYCISRNECESVSDFLRKNQIKALAYHAGLDDKRRAEVQHKWTNNVDCRVVCATIAFGMGIDKAYEIVIYIFIPIL
jgi:bloom syndrome protein